MSTILSLQISMGIPASNKVGAKSSKCGSKLPVRVKNDDSIGSLQVQTETTCTRGENEDPNVGVLRIEHLHMPGTFVSLCATVEAQVLPAHHLEEIFHNVHDFSHLEEDEDLNHEIRERRKKYALKHTL
jgi:hypothetical protein